VTRRTEEPSIAEAVLGAKVGDRAGFEKTVIAEGVAVVRGEAVVLLAPVS